MACVSSRYTDVNGDEVVKCTSADMTDVEPTLPQPPVGLEVVGRTYGTLDLKADYPDPANGDAVFVQGYAFQCSLESECNSSGPWFPSSAPFAADPTTPVTVSGLAEDTTYNCWSATVVGASEPYEYFCSDPVQDATTDEAQLAVVGSPGTSSFFLNALGLDDPTDVPSFEGWAFQCVANILGSYGPCDPSGTWYVGRQIVLACIPLFCLLDPPYAMHSAPPVSSSDPAVSTLKQYKLVVSRAYHTIPTM